MSPKNYICYWTVEVYTHMLNILIVLEDFKKFGV